MIGFRLSKILTQLAYPLSIAMLLLVIALALAWRGRARASRLWLTAGVALLWLSSLPAVGYHVNDFLESSYPPVPPERAESAGAIVLLGGAISPPYPPLYWMDLNDSADRIVHAARLHRAGKAPIILIAGGGGPYIGGPQTPADAMADLLVEWGIPRDALVLERKSRNTWENALYAKELLDERGIRRVLVVTSAAHMLRSLAIFRTLGFDAIPAGTDYMGGGRIDYSNPLVWLPDAGSLRATAAGLKEYMGIAVYVARGWIRRDELRREAASAPSRPSP